MLNITREQAKWILQSYVPIKGHGKITNHKSVILETLSILRGQPVNIGCNCELPALARITNDMFDQYRTEIETIATTEPVIENELQTVTRRGRKASKGNTGEE